MPGIENVFLGPLTQVQVESLPSVGLLAGNGEPLKQENGGKFNKGSIYKEGKRFKMDNSSRETKADQGA